jgi:hypothetical protein
LLSLKDKLSQDAFVGCWRDRAQSKFTKSNPPQIECILQSRSLITKRKIIRKDTGYFLARKTINPSKSHDRNSE